MSKHTVHPINLVLRTFDGLFFSSNVKLLIFDHAMITATLIMSISVCGVTVVWSPGWKNAQLAQQLEERERRIKNHLDLAAKGQSPH